MSFTPLDDLAEPVISAPMAGASGGRLAAAVTAAGGLGMIGFGATVGREVIAAQSAIARGDTSGGLPGAAFGLGLMLWALEERPELLDAAIEERPTLLSLSFGDPAPFVPRARQAGIAVCTQVGTLEEARRAVDAGADLLVARGSEGGGHGRADVATLPLLQQVLEACEVPVVAAGGIGTARGVAAVLAAGAVAAWVGTPFAACSESEASDAVKQAIIDRDASGTVYTRVFDVAQRLGWPAAYGGRALANDFSHEWADRMSELEDVVARGDDIPSRMNAARAGGDLSIVPVYAGQSAGLVTRPRTAAELVADLAGFRRHLLAAQRWT